MQFLRKFAWIGGALGALMVIAFIAHRVTTGTFDATWSGLGAGGAALLMLYLWLDRDELASATGGRGARYSTMAVLLTLVAAGLAVAVNVLAARYDKRWDATLTGAHTLSEQSAQVAAGLTRDVDIVAFFPTDDPEGMAFRDLVEGYQEHTGRVTFKMLDPVKEPMLAQQFEITSGYGTVVLASGEDKQRLETDFGEEALTNALVRLTSGREHILCFTEGHGEREVDDEFTAEGLGALILKLEGQNYTVKKFVPLRDQVPDDCEVVVLADPQQDPLPPEVEALSRYVAGGGALVALLEPLHADGFAASLARFGIEVGQDIVLEENPSYQLMGGDISWLIFTRDSYDFHPLLQGLDGLTLFRVARSVSMAPPIDGIKVQPLIRTTDQGWGEADLLSGAPPEPTMGQDIIGRVPVMTLAEVIDPMALQIGATTLPSGGGASGDEASQGGPEGEDGDIISIQVSEGDEVVSVQIDGTPSEGGEGDASDEGDAGDSAEDSSWRKAGGRVVVFGDSDFISNELLIQGNNQDLFMNTIAWLVGEEDQIAIRPNEAGEQTLTMTFIDGFLVWGLSVFGVPFMAMAAGIRTWMERRRL